MPIDPTQTGVLIVSLTITQKLLTLLEKRLRKKNGEDPAEKQLIDLKRHISVLAREARRRGWNLSIEVGDDR